ncbi:MAG: tRNA epoxyqueuosine(34) reductase QueG [Bryobacteraceae bacterium]
MAALTASRVKHLAQECGFELAGIARAAPAADFARYEAWLAAGFAGEMAYLADHRATLRADPQNLLASARSILCVGKLYNTAEPYSNAAELSGRGWISRYAWGDDYHDVLRSMLDRLVQRLREESSEPFESRICVDTAPLLERSYAHLAGLGWIGKNACLINERQGSWFLLGEVLLSCDLAPDAPPPDRCGTCTRCIDACPTQAIVPDDQGGFRLDARLCISYFTIEKRGAIAEDQQAGLGNHVFGCDICQDVCPWNRGAPATDDSAFQPRSFAPPLEDLAALTETGFRAQFRHTPLWRTKYSGFLRNVAIAMGNSADVSFLPALEGLAQHADPVVAASAQQALERLRVGGIRREG